MYKKTAENYTPKEVQLAAHYGMTVPDMRKTVEAAKLYSNVACDENAMPIGCSVEQ